LERDVPKSAARGFDTGAFEVRQRVEVGSAEAEVAQQVIVEPGEPVGRDAGAGGPGRAGEDREQGRHQ
jgi:hypothetical protein